MPFISLREIVDVIIMTVVVGIIFSDAFKGYFHLKRKQIDVTDPEYYRVNYGLWNRIGVDKEAIRLAIIVTAPAVVLHELAHKFVAIAFGIAATFKASYFGLMLGLVLKVVFPGFVFFIPGYVEISSIIEPLKHAVIAFAGPGMNLILWLGSAYLLKKNQSKTNTNHQAKINPKVINLKGKWLLILHMTKRINMFLFILNMLPIPIFDGFKVYEGIIRTFF